MIFRCPNLPILVIALAISPSPADAQSFQLGDPEALCRSLVQGKIAWNHDGEKRWAENNLKTLCEGSKKPAEPGKCFRTVMHGRIDWGGGTVWRWENALNLCAGTEDAVATVDCFRGRIRQGKSWRGAIDACKRTVSLSQDTLSGQFTFEPPQGMPPRLAGDTRLTSLRGNTRCQWGSADCNPCVKDVRAKLRGLQNNYQAAGRIRFDGYAYPTRDYLLHRLSDGHFEHIQSIARIAGLGNDEYLVFTHSTCSGQRDKNGSLAVVRLGAQQTSGGGPLRGMPDGDGSDQRTANRTVARTYSGNNHPGGIAVLGHFVYVAQWCQPEGNPGDWCQRSSARDRGTGFSVYDVSQVHRNSKINANPPKHLHYRHVWADSWIGKQSTASVAAVQLSTGRYLVALGRSGGEEYGFYTAPTPSGRFVFENSSRIDYWGQNANIVTECGTGDLYLLQMEAYRNKVDKVHLFRLLLNDGEIGFQYIESRTFHCRGSRIDGAGDWCDFDAGASVYVTPNGGLLLYAIDLQQSSHGNVRLVEFR